jgi:hypothetical protein
MAGLVRYEIKNEASLKAQSQNVVDKVAFELGFQTKRKELNIQIRFKKGATHANWCNGKSVLSEDLINMLVSGYRCRKPGRIRRTGATVPARPVFDNYLELYSERMRDTVIKTFQTYSHWSIPDRCRMAGKKIIDDFKKQIYSGSLGLAPNQGKYALRKMGAGYGDIPLVATKKLFEDLEVVVE